METTSIRTDNQPTMGQSGSSQAFGKGTIPGIDGVAITVHLEYGAARGVWKSGSCFTGLRKRPTTANGALSLMSLTLPVARQTTTSGDTWSKGILPSPGNLTCLTRSVGRTQRPTSERLKLRSNRPNARARRLHTTPPSFTFGSRTLSRFSSLCTVTSAKRIPTVSRISGYAHFSKSSAKTHQSLHPFNPKPSGTTKRPGQPRWKRKLTHAPTSHHSRLVTQRRRNRDTPQHARQPRRLR